MMQYIGLEVFYCYHPKYLQIDLSAKSVDPDQTALKSSLIRVCTGCHLFHSFSDSWNVVRCSDIEGNYKSSNKVIFIACLEVIYVNILWNWLRIYYTRPWLSWQSAVNQLVAIYSLSRSWLFNFTLHNPLSGYTRLHELSLFINNWDVHFKYTPGLCEPKWRQTGQIWVWLNLQVIIMFCHIVMDTHPETPDSQQSY